MTAPKQYICHLESHDGYYLIGHTDKGRLKRLIDLWCRLRFFLRVFPEEYSAQSRPFRLIKSLRASLTRACIFDRNIRQAQQKTTKQ